MTVKMQSLEEFRGHDLDFLGSRDVISHVTIRLGMGIFLLVVNDDHASILHGYEDTGPQRFWGHNFDFWGSRDVIGHMTNGFVVVTFIGGQWSCIVMEI